MEEDAEKLEHSTKTQIYDEFLHSVHGSYADRMIYPDRGIFVSVSPVTINKNIQYFVTHTKRKRRYTKI